MKIAHTLTALALAALLSTSASAQQRRRDAGNSHERPNREQVLERFDTNRDGRLDQRERDAARKAIGQQRDAAHKAIRRQGDGPRPNVGERGTSPKQRGERLMPAELLKRFDANKDGKLDEAERATARKALGQMRAKTRLGDDAQGLSPTGRGARPIFSEILKRFDANKDGKLDEAERAKARKALAQRHARQGDGQRRRRAARGGGRGDEHGNRGERAPQRHHRGDGGPPSRGRVKGDER